MAGIYLHIPFCRRACHYCNFHFSTSLGQRDKVLKALEKELQLQKGYLEGQAIDTIYFGGGTPSLLTEKELNALLNTIFSTQEVLPQAEITLEANPDDINRDNIAGWKRIGINRLSVGIQSFFDEDLQFMNRIHSGQEARQALEWLLEAGIQNISADLIYGSPTTSHQMWEANIEEMLAWGIPHLSAYCLTVEAGTALDHFVRKGKVSPVNDEKAIEQFNLLMDRLEDGGYLHYEISNFSLPGMESKHNSNYWKGAPYLGIGPSAHSYNIHSRQWNIAHNSKYIKALEEGIIPFESEVITPDDRYNEYIMTSLRTMKGCSLLVLESMGNAYTSWFQATCRPFLENGLLELLPDRHYRLTRSGKHLADHISSCLFIG